MTMFEREMFEKKLAIIDVLFQHMDVEELQRMADAEKIVDKLKGLPSPYGPLRQIFTEHQILQSDIGTLRMELQSLKTDFKMLIEAVDKPYQNTSQMMNVKSRYQVY